MKALLIIIASLISGTLFSQTGTIIGKVTDKQSEFPLMGATVELLNMPTAFGVITDSDGQFILREVPVGRQTIRISYIGYESLTLPNIIVTAGKDANINALLTEGFTTLDEVILISDAQRDQPLNKAATVSARQFGLEEVTRFSGGRSDVGRLAANYAGVSTPDDSRNDIVIRGNSPTGLLWRIEGIPIPNPNHFAAFGTTGGPVSAINPNMLKNSDFLTSAFPSECGNALGGVFDLGFRKGNSENHEFSFQAGAFTGLEATAEGPLSRDQGTYLVAARYSLVGLIGAGAAGASSAVPNYADVAFNLDFGQGKWGRFGVFGLLGTSDIDFLGDEIDESDLFAAEDEDLFVQSGFGVLGATHRLRFGQNTFLKSTVAGSFTSNDIFSNRFIDKNTPQERSIRYFETDNREQRFTVSTVLNSKLSNRITFRTGLITEFYNLESFLRDREKQADTNGDGDPDLVTLRDTYESFQLWQPYAQGRFRILENLILNAGVHGQYSSLNEQFALEPRAGLQYNLSENQTLSVGYGLHQQTLPLPMLFLIENLNGQEVQTNRGLDFVRSNHFVLGYDIRLGQQWRGKVEAYYQDIDKAAVSPEPGSYSSLTEGADFEFETDRVGLVSEGTGFNRGLEFTLEKFFSQGYYALLTGSVYESKYTGSDGIERNTPFNNGYVLNFLTGKEFSIGKGKWNVLFVDTRISTSGGRYFTPVDLQASQAAGFEILQEDLAYSERFDPYFRWDLKFGIRINAKNKNQTHQFYVDLQNFTDNDNVFVQRYNRLTNEVNVVNQVGFFPDFGYRFQF